MKKVDLKVIKYEGGEFSYAGMLGDYMKSISRNSDGAINGWGPRNPMLTPEDVDVAGQVAELLNKAKPVTYVEDKIADYLCRMAAEFPLNPAVVDVAADAMREFKQDFVDLQAAPGKSLDELKKDKS